MPSQDDDDNVMSILVATDIHVGYAEKSMERGRDSFVALEEIFIIAKEKKVDFILMGGDLFHENKPSRKTLHNTMELFRKYCLGDRPCNVEVISDQSVNFGHTSSSITTVNYEDPNMNIGMPVFSIHGNHDDPTGAGELSAIDILSVSGLLNHFGKQTNLDQINISPVLLKKGTTKLALYGLGSIRDERLHRMFTKQLVTMLRPREDKESWFNIFVIHQNRHNKSGRKIVRSKHGPTNYIPEEFLDEFFDLVVWGHEHECLIKPQWNSVKNFFVMQPGSSVATSLCEGESAPKQVAVLKIRGREMKPEFIPLRTPRQMYVETLRLADLIPTRGCSEEQLEERAKALCEEKVEELLCLAEDERSGHPKQPLKPLIRLRVDYSEGFPMFNSYRFGAKYADRVANPENIVHFLKKSVKRENASGIDVRDMDAMIGAEVVEKVKMEDLVEEYLNTKDKKDQMGLLTARGVSQAVSEFVNKQERDAISELCTHQINKTKSYLEENEPSLNKNDITLEITKFHDERERITQEKSRINPSEDAEELQAILERARAERRAKGEPDTYLSSDENQIEMDDNDDISSNHSTATTAPRGRGRGRGRGSRGGRGAKTGARGRKAPAATSTPRNPPPSAVDSSFGQQSTIKSAFQRQSQQLRDSQVLSTTVTSSRPRSRHDVITLEDDTSFSMPSRARAAPKASKAAPVKRGRGKGVDFDNSSDEGENPFTQFGSKRKR